MFGYRVMVFALRLWAVDQTQQSTADCTLQAAHTDTQGSALLHHQTESVCFNGFQDRFEVREKGKKGVLRRYTERDRERKKGQVQPFSLAIQAQLSAAVTPERRAVPRLCLSMLHSLLQLP